MSYYDIILQDLTAEMETSYYMQDTPYSIKMGAKIKIKITYECLLRAQRLR